jgi:competence protein ComEA
MFRKFLRELHMLPRWEQRALILFSLVLILTLAIRVTIRAIPPKEPDGLQEFVQEVRALLDPVPGADTREDTGMSSRYLPETDSDGATYTSFRMKRQVPVNISINRADSADLLPLPGIGPVLSGRIVRFRELLGGYVSADQLSMVYGLDSMTLDRIRGQILIDTSVLRRLDINQADFRTLLRHPYLQYDDVRALMEYRLYDSCIQTPDEIRESEIWADSTLDRITPYLLFEP